MINMPQEKVKRLADTMMEARSKVRYCTGCYTLTDSEKCPVCSDASRDHSVIMVVEDTSDMAAY
jgi:recombination protein RecR